jgi:CubicO group peptidase (beta-lactamase class C family)
MNRRQFLATTAALAAPAGPNPRLAAADRPAPDPGSAAHHKLAAAYSAAHKGISCLVMVDGKTVFEDYPNGGKAGRAHELASGTKSFAGVLAVAAATDGLLNLDERAAATLPEWKGDPRKSRVTLRQILSLTSGLPGGEGGRVPAYADAIQQPCAHEPGARFAYGPVPFQVFGEILRRKLGPTKGGVFEYLKRRLLDPIGLAVGFWRRGADRNPHVPSGARLTAREWAKFGELVRRKGAWDGRQVVPADALEGCFQGTAANPAYGLTWWLNRPVPRDKLRTIPQLWAASDVVTRGERLVPDLVFAAGAGKQRLYVSRALKLVAVRQAEGIRAALAGGERSGFSDAEFLARLVFGTDATGQAVSG